MIKLPLHTRINLRAKLATTKGACNILRDTVNAQAACDAFWRCFGYPLGFWLANPYRSTGWRAGRHERMKEFHLNRISQEAVKNAN